MDGQTKMETESTGRRIVGRRQQRSTDKASERAYYVCTTYLCVNKRGLTFGCFPLAFHVEAPRSKPIQTNRQEVWIYYDRIDPCKLQPILWSRGGDP